MALLWYGPYLYSTIFCMAIAIYGTVVSPTNGIAKLDAQVCEGQATTMILEIPRSMCFSLVPM